MPAAYISDPFKSPPRFPPSQRCAAPYSNRQEGGGMKLHSELGLRLRETDITGSDTYSAGIIVTWALKKGDKAETK